MPSDSSDSVASILSVPRFTEMPGVRAFSRRVDALLESTEILDRAWRGAVEQAGDAGRSMTSLFPDWEALAVRWDSFVNDVRNVQRDAVRWFRAAARDAVRYVNGLIRELDEFLGFTAMWSELREWVLRELRSFRGGATMRERLDRVENTTGVTLGLALAVVVLGAGAWAAFEWKKAQRTKLLLERLGDDDDPLL